MSHELHNVDMGALAALVQQENDELDKLVGISSQESSAMSAALRDVFEAQKKAKITKAAGEVLKVLDAADSNLETTVKEIRSLRMRERAYLDKLKRITRAKEYAMATMNLLPLVSVLKGNSEHLVPDSWKAPKVSKPVGK